MKALLKKFDNKLLCQLIFMCIAIMFMTFDSYALSQITTETPLIKLGDIPLYRMEFISVLFVICACFGKVITILFRKHMPTISKISATIFALIILFVAILDVDIFQSLFPTMRISHAIMTLSLLTAIMIGASGLFASIALFSCSENNLKFKDMAIATIIAVALSILAINQNWYFIIYALSAVAVLFTSLICRPYNAVICSQLSKKPSRISVMEVLINIISKFSIILILLTSYNYLTVTIYLTLNTYIIILGGSFVAYSFIDSIFNSSIAKYIIVTLAIILSATCIFVSSQIIVCLAYLLLSCALGLFKGKTPTNTVKDITSVVAILFSSIVSIILLRDMATITKFSNNRIIYALDNQFFIIATCLVILLVVCQLLKVLLIDKNRKTVQ